MKNKVYYARGGVDTVITEKDMRDALDSTFKELGVIDSVLIIPPDISRLHSRAGEITRMTYDFYGDKVKDIMPALGTHMKMTAEELEKMFPGVPLDLFREHKWREDIVSLGDVPAEYVKEQSGGLVDYPYPAQVNKILAEGGHDLALSIGQVVPHEVIGLANYTKNIFVGLGGAEGIHKSHFLGAVYGMERIMGRVDTPVRNVLNRAADMFTQHLPLIYVLTVLGPDSEGGLVMRGLYIGEGYDCYRQAAELSVKVNFERVEKPIKKCVVYLDPDEFRSTWIGNKAVYRTRMALADGAELIVIAPGAREFGEDPEIDPLIRKYGYCGTEKVLEAVKNNKDLQDNLSSAAHLIHGSSEGRFSISYAPGSLTKDEIEGVGYKYLDCKETMEKYMSEKRMTGWHEIAGEEIFFVANPATGLWAHESRLTD